MKALPIILVIVGIAVLGCGLIGWALLRAGSASMEPPPVQLTTKPGFDGELVDRWRQRRGGFTGDEALIPLDHDLSAQWPNGSVVQLTLGGGDYELTVVEASGSGTLLSKKLYRESGTWSQASQTTMTLTPTKATLVIREHGERTSRPASTSPRTYAMSSRITERGGQPGASPATTEALILEGPCVTTGGTCTWEFEAE